MTLFGKRNSREYCPFIEVENIEYIKKYFKLPKDPVFVENDLDSIRYIEDINGRRYYDAFVLSLLSANLNGPKLDIGTHYGRSAARMAINSPKDIIYTVNVSPEQAKEAGILVTNILSKRDIGSFYKTRRLKNIKQIYANTKNWVVPDEIFDLSLVYIDGCHDADFVYSDTAKIIDRVKSGGFILWHDCSPRYRENFLWINESMRGIEKLVKKKIVKGYILNLKHSWVGIWKKP